MISLFWFVICKKFTRTRVESTYFLLTRTSQDYPGNLGLVVTEAANMQSVWGTVLPNTTAEVEYYLFSFEK